MDKTIFEKIIEKSIPAHIVYEDENTIVILDINPKSLGHTLVIPKVVSRNILDMPQDLLGQYFAVVQKVAQAIKQGLDCDGLNIIMNTEPAAGQEVFHTHTHIIPRYINDQLDLNPGIHQSYSSQEHMKEHIEKIKAFLS